MNVQEIEKFYSECEELGLIDYEGWKLSCADIENISVCAISLDEWDYILNSLLD